MSSERQRQPRKSSSPSLLEELMPDVRRRTIVFAVVRSLVVVTLIVAAYFTLPFTRPRGVGPIAGIVIGLIVLATVLVLQIRATMRSPYPGMRAFEALASSGPLFLILFASTHYLIEHHATHSYSQTMTRLRVLFGRIGLALWRFVRRATATFDSDFYCTEQHANDDEDEQ